MKHAGIEPDAFNAFEAAGWEKRAEDYDRFFRQLTSRMVQPLLDAASVTSGTRVLDIATGPGYVAGQAAARGAEVVGVDIAEAMVALARRLHLDVDFRQADAHALPFDDSSFDAVVGNFAILHLGRPEQAAAEFARVLVPAAGSRSLPGTHLTTHAFSACSSGPSRRPGRRLPKTCLPGRTSSASRTTKSSTRSSVTRAWTTGEFKRSSSP
jgi:ubiquinone/menaquinone biosynthesis C-methylase UbiE